VKSIIIIVALLVAPVVRAEVLYRGKVYRITADHIIERERMFCVRGATRLEALPDGSLAIITSKVCVREGRNNDGR